MSYNELVKRIAQNDSTLTRVDLSRKNIDDVGARKIAEALLTNTTVKEIDLGNNRISAEGARALAEMLRHNATLAKLNLGRNSIGAEGARALAEALPHNAALTTLYLVENGIGVEGARALAGALPRNATLTTLYLGGNRVGAEGARALAGALPRNAALATLDLKNNGVGDEGARALAGALPRNATLATLNLEGNGVGDEGARVLADTLHFQNHSLKSLGRFFRPADGDLKRRNEFYLEINRERRSPMGAYIRKTRLFPKSHIGSLTAQSIVLPKAVEHLGHISGGLSIVFCFVQETHTALLAFKNGSGTRKRTVKRICATPEREAKQRKEKFLMIARALMKYLKQKDPKMHAQAKAVIKACAERNKAGDAAYSSLTSSMQTHLRGMVGEVYWKKAEDYLNHFLKQKLKQQQMEAQKRAAAAAAAAVMSQQQQQPQPGHVPSAVAAKVTSAAPGAAAPPPGSKTAQPMTAVQVAQLEQERERERQREETWRKIAEQDRERVKKAEAAKKKRQKGAEAVSSTPAGKSESTQAKRARIQATTPSSAKKTCRQRKEQTPIKRFFGKDRPPIVPITLSQRGGTPEFSQAMPSQGTTGAEVDDAAMRPTAEEPGADDRKDDATKETAPQVVADSA